MKKYVLVKKSFASKLKKFVSKRSDEELKPGRFIGLMQENRTKAPKRRRKYAAIDFDFKLDDFAKKIKID